MNIPLSQPNITAMEIHFVNQAMEDGWISGTGPNITKFESSLGNVVGRNYAVAVTNGTVALEIVLKALGIGPGDEVIVPALTFVSPAAAVRSVGATVVLAEIDPLTWTIDPLDIEEKITSRTRAVIAVDLLGHPADFGAIEAVISRSANQPIYIIEDAAEAHGAAYTKNAFVPCGALGFVSTFSFHANKAISTGEGGAILTDGKGLYENVRLYANHGMTSKLPYWHEIFGTNGRMTNITASIGLAQVLRWFELTRARQYVARMYDERLKPLFDSGILQRRPVADWAQESCWLYTVASPYRAQFLDALNRKGIDGRAIWYALPDLPPYHSDEPFTHARQVANQAFWLPTWADMPISAIDFICEVLRECPIQLTTF